MRKLRFTAIAAAAITLSAMVPGALAGAATAAAPSGTVPVGHSSLNFGPCSDPTLQFFGSQCAMLSVPLDYNNPTGPKVQIAVSRHLHTSNHYQGIMLVNPGGPGGSGLIYSVFGDPRVLGDQQAAADYDWIGFDPRGVGSSVPSVSCIPDYFAHTPRPNYVPVNSADLATWDARSQGYANACAANNGPILNHVTTVDNAKDMDSIRKALGMSQLNYYGFSYGTYLGQVYGTLFGSHVRRMVLDSNVDSRNVWYQANLSQDLAFQPNLETWLGWLAQYDSVYHLGTTEKAVATLFYKTQAALTFHPDGALGGDEWVDTFLYAGYYQSTWLQLAKAFSRYVNNGDTQAVLRQYATFNSRTDDNGFAMYLGTECTDISWPKESKQLADNWAVYRQAPFETWGNYWFNAPCMWWPAAPHSTTPMQIDMSHVSSALLIDETHDAATPYEGSLYLRSIFPNSRLLALPGGTTHAGSLGSNACENAVDFAYLDNGTLPADAGGDGPDATCAPNPQPVPHQGNYPSPTSPISTLKANLQLNRAMLP